MCSDVAMENILQNLSETYNYYNGYYNGPSVKTTSEKFFVNIGVLC